MVRSRSSVSSLGANSVTVETNTGSAHPTSTGGTVITSQPKPKLVKQKQSLCEKEILRSGMLVFECFASPFLSLANVPPT